MKSRARKFLLNLSLFALGIAVLLAVLAFLGIQQIVAVLSTTNILLFSAGFLIYIANIVFLSLRLRTLSSLPFVRSMKITMVGLFFNVITPVAKVGGEPVKILMMKKPQGIPRASAAIAIDTMSEILVSFAVFIVIILMYQSVVPSYIVQAAFVLLAVSLAIIFVFVRILLNYKWAKKIAGFLQKLPLADKALSGTRYVKVFQRAFRILVKDKRVMFQVLFYTLLGKLAEFARLWLVFLAIGIFLPIEFVLVGWALLLILLVIPGLPGNIGIVEGGGAAAFILLGVTSSFAAAGMLLERLISFWFVLAAGAVVMIISKRRSGHSLS